MLIYEKWRQICGKPWRYKFRPTARKGTMIENIEIISVFIEPASHIQKYVKSVDVVISNIIGVLAIITTIMPIFKIFSPINKAIGIEDYSTRVKARLKYSIGFIMLFAMITLALGTYEEWWGKSYANKNTIIFLGLIYFMLGIIFLIICIVASMIKITKKVFKSLDKYQKNFEWENVRFGWYTSFSFMIMGVAIVINKLLIQRGILTTSILSRNGKKM